MYPRLKRLVVLRQRQVVELLSGRARVRPHSFERLLIERINPIFQETVHSK